MGSHNLMKTLGQTIGISVSGLWLSDQLYGDELEQSLHTIFILLVAIAVVTLAVTAFLRQRSQLAQSVGNK